MSTTRLLIDAGNTRIKWAKVSGLEWLSNGVIPLSQGEMLFRHFSEVQNIQEAWVSNVAGEEVARQIRNINLGQPSLIKFIVAQEMQCGVINGYTNASQLGSDRWAAMIAAWNLVKGKCLVVNCGTAITIDSLTEQGKFIGGIILPGPDLMKQSLIAATKQLRLEDGKCVEFPLNTADALYSGTIHACCGTIERQYALLGDKSLPIILSGGAAGLLKDYIGLPVKVIDNLVLQGLLQIALEADAK